MPTKPETNGKDNLIAVLIKLFEQRLPEPQAVLLSKFSRHYFVHTSMDDLITKEIEDLYGIVLSHWTFLYQRQPGETKLRIFKPSFEKDGWKSAHTIIQLIQDDMPFIVDSLQMEINRLGFTMHFMVHLGGIKFLRDKEGKVIDILPSDSKNDQALPEAPVYIEIDGQNGSETLSELEANLSRVLSDVQIAVKDWQKMREKVQQTLEELEAVQLRLDPQELAETRDFLKWMVDDHFTFLGCRDYELVGLGQARELRIIEGSGLGVLREDGATHSARLFSNMPIEAQQLLLSHDQLLIIAKTNTISTVHRPVHTDYIGAKLFDKKGNVIGERRFIGLYTSTAYNSNPKHIPFLRRKVATILEKSQLPLNGHAGKALLTVIETLPRDDLFQAPVEELLTLCMGIVQMQERQLVRLFARKDLYGRFVSCLVYVPRDRFNTALREQIEQILLEELHGTSTNYFTRFSDSILACMHFIVRVNPKDPQEYDLKAIEKKIIDAARTWQDDLKQDLLEHYGEEKGIALFQRYARIIPAGYMEMVSPRVAVFDIERIESITEEEPLAMSFVKFMEDGEEILRLKLYSLQTTLVLSNVLPILENMGLRVIGERPYRFRFSQTQWAWINEFTLQYCSEHELNLEKVRPIFEEAFKKIWFGQMANDGFNRLILEAGIMWEEVRILRAYAKYSCQIGFTYSQNLIEATLSRYPEVAQLLIELFHLRFDPKRQNNSEANIQTIESQLHKLIDSVTSLDQDRILRHYYELIMATLRTNYYQQPRENKTKTYISFKFNPHKISNMPLPLPMFEIFVYSPRFEGIHLRAAKVARGGLRWSDRFEDFRTEVLGLMKAQQVKNALIVPLGAKGGFVAKQLPQQGSREEIMQEGIYCYQNFIRALLDITDNLKDGVVIKPKNTVCYDEDDTYLVVAADKGTATFSDIANEIAKEYGFWLGDAFASGGGTGYDHKKMGITARGAWESVKHHFRSLNLNIQETPFTVIGIGDMGGDVFGNGMLLSRQIKLVAAFNHVHIFIDPNPDPAVSFEERQRLFNARGGWSEYNPALISKGGGVFSRTAKSIALTPEMKGLLDVDKDTMTPADLMNTILKAKVDLFWNGGIGTFVKASTEQHTDVGDKANDLIRVNANELRCRVLGEGGNLGVTQLARIEYELNGGLLNTDFIDNSAGVDCSDHEVNIKILLNSIVRRGDMTEKQRNHLLAEMTEDVAELVLAHNYRQNQAISAIHKQVRDNLTVIARYMQAQERNGKLSRKLEFLPSDILLAERKAKGLGLTRPEIAVLLSYSKNITKQQILESDLPEDPYLAQVIEILFPQQLREKYRDAMQSHTLKREMIATRLSNFITDDTGIVFVYQLHEQSGASVSAIVRAYAAAKQVFRIGQLREQISALDYQVNAELQAEMLGTISQLARSTTRWFLRNRPKGFNIAETVDYFHRETVMLFEKLPYMVVGQEKEYWNSLVASYCEAGVSQETARSIATINLMFSALDIIDGATECGVSVEEFGRCYFALTDKLELSWIIKQIMEYTADDYWTIIARIALRDDIDWQRRALATSLLKAKKTAKNLEQHINQWMNDHGHLIGRWHALLAEIKGAATVDITRLSVAVRLLTDLSAIGFRAIMAPEERVQ